MQHRGSSTKPILYAVCFPTGREYTPNHRIRQRARWNP